LIEPFRWFNVSLQIVYNSGPTPTFSIPAADDYGYLQIGNISNLRYPEGGFNSDPRYALKEDILYGGAAGIIDMGTTADNFRSSFDLNGTRKAMGKLIHFLAVTARGINTYLPISITSIANQFVYGIEQYDNQIYSSILLSKDIKMVHVNFNQYITSLAFQMIAIL
jgi:hypothetical protein